MKEKLEPTETVTKMWREMKEKLNNQKEEWKERKKQMKETYKDLKKKAGESKDELVKMWKENEGTWRQKAEQVSAALCSFNTRRLAFTLSLNVCKNFRVFFFFPCKTKEKLRLVFPFYGFVSEVLIFENFKLCGKKHYQLDQQKSKKVDNIVRVLSQTLPSLK